MVSNVGATAQRYAAALATAIVASLRTDPPPGVPVRVVIRWFEGPDYLTIHALGSEEEAEVPADDAWYPLEWMNEPREIERATAILADAEVASAAAALAAELEEGSWSWEEQPEPLVAAAAMLRERLQNEGVALPDHFAVGVCHFEGWGAEESVPRANPGAVVDLLRRRRLAPTE